MKTTLEPIASALLISMLAVAAAPANAAMAPPPGDTASVRYTTGGASPGGVARMHAMENDYDLLIHVQAPGGGDAYDGLRMTLLDESGKQVVDSAAGGPLFYAQVPTGRYEVKAERHGKTTTREIVVDPGKTARLDIDMPQ